MRYLINKLIIILLIFIINITLQNCAVMISNLRLTKKEILDKLNRNNLISYSKQEALDLIKEFYEGKGDEVDITKKRFYYFKHYSNGYFEVRFAWNLISDVEIRELKWDDGSSKYKIIIHFPVIESGKKKYVQFDFASFPTYGNDYLLLKLLSAIYTLRDESSDYYIPVPTY